MSFKAALCLLPALTAVTAESLFQSSAYEAGSLGNAPVQSFHSSTLSPPLVNFLTNSTSASTNYTLIAYRGTGVSQPAPMILDSKGELVWSGAAYGNSMDTIVQEYLGEPVLTFFNGSFYSGGYGSGKWVILDKNYDIVRTVTMPNQTADTSDFHEFVIIPESNTALLESWVVTQTDLSSVNGSTTGWTWDCRFAELDLATNTTIFEWHSLDHVPVTESYFAISNGTGDSEDNPWDYCHINSLEKDQAGNYLVSMRGPSTIYSISATTGEILWRLSGKNSNFTMGTDTTFWYQHDARLQSNISVSPFTMSVFDNAAGGSGNVEATARGLILSVDTSAMTVSLVHEYIPSFNTTAGSQGSVQPLSNGNVFIGWGAEPYYTEYTSDGTIINDVHFAAADVTTVESYRAFTMAWTGYPTTTPDFAINSTSAYASWNGATEVATWELMGGNSTTGLASVSNVTRSGFETQLPITGSYKYLSAVALTSNGSCLGATEVFEVSTQASSGTAGSCPSGSKTVGGSTSTGTSAKSGAGRLGRSGAIALVAVACALALLL